MATPRALSQRLILAIETGRMDQVQAAIRDGADVNNTRKLVYVRAELDDTGDEVEEVEEAEDAMVLAIREKRSDMVRTLLEGGYDPNQPISWRLALPRDSWTSENWLDPGPWDTRSNATPSFRSALELALTHRRLRFSPSGDPVELDEPTTDEEVCVVRMVIPTVEVARTLLKAGAKVTDKELQAAEDVGGGKGGELYELVASFTPEKLQEKAAAQELAEAEEAARAEAAAREAEEEAARAKEEAARLAMEEEETHAATNGDAHIVPETDVVGTDTTPDAVKVVPDEEVADVGNEYVEEEEDEERVAVEDGEKTETVDVDMTKMVETADGEKASVDDVKVDEAAETLEAADGDAEGLDKKIPVEAVDKKELEDVVPMDEVTEAPVGTSPGVNAVQTLEDRPAESVAVVDTADPAPTEDVDIAYAVVPSSIRVEAPGSEPEVEEEEEEELDVELVPPSGAPPEPPVVEHGDEQVVNGDVDLAVQEGEQVLVSARQDNHPTCLSIPSLSLSLSSHDLPTTSTPAPLSPIVVPSLTFTAPSPPPSDAGDEDDDLVVIHPPQQEHTAEWVKVLAEMETEGVGAPPPEPFPGGVLVEEPEEVGIAAEAADMEVVDVRGPGGYGLDHEGERGVTEGVQREVYGEGWKVGSELDPRDHHLASRDDHEVPPSEAGAVAGSEPATEPDMVEYSVGQTSEGSGEVVDLHVPGMDAENVEVEGTVPSEVRGTPLVAHPAVQPAEFATPWTEVSRDPFEDPDRMYLYERAIPASSNEALAAVDVASVVEDGVDARPLPSTEEVQSRATATAVLAMAASTAQSAVAYVLRTHTADFDDHTDALTVGGTSSVEYARTESPDLAEEPVEETDLHPGLGESLAAPTLARASRALTPDLISFDETGGVDFKVDDDQGLPPSPSAPPEAFTRAVIEAEEGRASLLTTSIDESGQDHVPQINDVQRTEPPSTSRAIPVGEARLPSENDWMSALSPAPSPSRGATSTPPSSEVEDLRQQLSLVRDVLKRERAEADVRERRHELEVANLRREVDSLRDGAKVRESEHARQVDELLYGFDQQSQGERAKIAERQQSEMEDMRATSRQLNMAYEKMNAEHEWEKERIREDAVKQQQAFKRREAELQQEAARLKPILQAQLEAHKKNQEEQQRKIAELQKKVDGRTAALQQRESEHQKVINELQRAVQGQRYEFETRISELTSTVEFFEHQLTEKEARISTTDRDVGHLRSRIAQLDDEGFEKGVRIAFFQQELKERDRQITALTQKALAASSRGIAGAPGDNRNGTGTRGVHKKNVVNQVLYAVQSFQPQRPDEIPLRVGDAVLRMFAFEDGWSAGLNKSGVQSGFFPSSCLSPDQPLGSHAPHPTGKVPTRSSSLGEIVANGVAH